MQKPAPGFKIEHRCHLEAFGHFICFDAIFFHKNIYIVANFGIE
jgi:hypothetical protein